MIAKSLMQTGGSFFINFPSNQILSRFFFVFESFNDYCHFRGPHKFRVPSLGGEIVPPYLRYIAKASTFSLTLRAHLPLGVLIIRTNRRSFFMDRPICWLTGRYDSQVSGEHKSVKDQFPHGSRVLLFCLGHSRWSHRLMWTYSYPGKISLNYSSVNLYFFFKVMLTAQQSRVAFQHYRRICYLLTFYPRHFMVFSTVT